MQQLRREGVDLFYEEAAGGDQPILLVHGWCCDHTYFVPQFERYAMARPDDGASTVLWRADQ